MPTTPYREIIVRLADHFTDGDHVHSQDLPQLTDDDLSVVLNHEDGIGFDACRPAAYADIYNSAVHLTRAAKLAALALCLDAAIQHEAREFVTADVNIELCNRSEPVDDPMGRAMDDAGMCQADFA